MILSPGFGSFPSANCMILRVVGRNWDTPVYGLLILEHCNKEIYKVFGLTTSRRLTCIHAKLFPTVKRRTCIHILRCYSRNSYSGRHAIFSESSRLRLGDPWQKALQTTIEPTLFVDFCLISNTCSSVRPARNVNREIFLHRQEGFYVGKFGSVVDQAVLDNWPLCKHFRWSRHHKRQALLKI